MVRASHAWHRVSSGAPMRSLVLTTAQFEQYVAACGEPAQARELPSAAPDMGRTAAAGERFRIDVLPGRLVDWTDQAFLLIHLERVQRRGQSGSQARLELRRIGIRTATDFLRAFSKPRPQPSCERAFARPPIKELPLPEDQLRLLVAVLGAEPGLVPVWNWQLNGVPASWCHR